MSAPSASILSLRASSETWRSSVSTTTSSSLNVTCSMRTYPNRAPRRACQGLAPELDWSSGTPVAHQRTQLSRLGRVATYLARTQRAPGRWRTTKPCERGARRPTWRSTAGSGSASFRETSVERPAVPRFRRAVGPGSQKIVRMVRPTRTRALAPTRRRRRGRSHSRSGTGARRPSLGRRYAARHSRCRS